MLNDEDTYRNAGEQCGRGRREQDEARALHHHRWFSRAKALEAPEDRGRAESLFREGYARVA